MANNDATSPILGTGGAIAEGKIKRGGLKPPSTSPRPVVAPQGKPGNTKSKRLILAAGFAPAR
jgi:hypothetical protein